MQAPRAQFCALPCLTVGLLGLLPAALPPVRADGPSPAAKPAEILAGLRTFFETTAEPDGSFRPGVDSDYNACFYLYANGEVLTQAIAAHGDGADAAPLAIDHFEDAIDQLLCREIALTA